MKKFVFILILSLVLVFNVWAEMSVMEKKAWNKIAYVKYKQGGFIGLCHKNAILRAFEYAEKGYKVRTVRSLNLVGHHIFAEYYCPVKKKWLNTDDTVWFTNKDYNYKELGYEAYSIDYNPCQVVDLPKQLEEQIVFAKYRLLKYETNKDELIIEGGKYYYQSLIRSAKDFIKTLEKDLRKINRVWYKVE